MKNLKEQYIRYFGALTEAKATQEIEFQNLDFDIFFSIIIIGYHLVRPHYFMSLKQVLKCKHL